MEREIDAGVCVCVARCACGHLFDVRRVANGIYAGSTAGTQQSAVGSRVAEVLAVHSKCQANDL